MSKFSKKQKLMREKVDPNRSYSFVDAYSLLKEFAAVRFVESVDISVNLGVDPRKSDQVVRGSSVLPNGTGKQVRVAVFAQGIKADEAREVGADIVGFDDLAESIQKGNMDFDVVIASPDAMRVVGKLGQILGPRGLMPNPKVGTVTPDIVTAIKNAKAGQVRYRTDRAGIIHSSVGKIDFDVDAIRENIEFLLLDLKKAKPASAKGTYFKKLSLSTTMGPGLTLDQGSLSL
jgi:large subunit ribosomal protein L1